MEVELQIIRSVAKSKITEEAGDAAAVDRSRGSDLDSSDGMHDSLIRRDRLAGMIEVNCARIDPADVIDP